jgi:glycosyltransferase involved in cell wall biosynthesis
MTRDKPGVLTLHDVYAMTGHCSYNLECRRFTPDTRCGRCPHKGVYPEIGIDNTRLEWKLKDKAYGRSNLTVVAPTAWMADNARRGMLGRFKVHHIPNGLDTRIYRPLDKAWCRRVLDLPPPETGATVLMFGADGLMQPRKGGDLLLAALAGLAPALKRRLVLLTLGMGAEALAEQSGIATRPLGYVADDRLKAVAFSAADVFVLPTRWDNLPIVVQESLACGTPVVSFRVGGLPEMVRPEQTGLLAEPEDVPGLAAAIARLAEDTPARESMGSRCREFAAAEYDITVMIRRYLDLYQELLGTGPGARSACLLAIAGERPAENLGTRVS